MKLSDIQYQALRKAIEWVKSTNDPNFTEYKHLSVDTFLLHSLRSDGVRHKQTEKIILNLTQAYIEKKLEPQT